MNQNLHNQIYGFIGSYAGLLFLFVERYISLCF